MRKVSFLFMIAVFSLVLTACGGFLGFDIDDQKGIDDNLKPKLSEFIPENASIVEVRLQQDASGSFSKTIGAANVTYFKEGDQELTSTYITLSGKTEAKDGMVSPVFKNFNGALKVSPSDGQKLNDIDFSKIASIVNKATEKVAADNNEFSGINGFTIKPNSDPAKVSYEFMIQSRQDSKTTTKGGRLATEISYLEYNFVADAEGNITQK